MYPAIMFNFQPQIMVEMFQGHMANVEWVNEGFLGVSGADQVFTWVMSSFAIELRRIISIFNLGGQVVADESHVPNLVLNH